MAEDRADLPDLGRMTPLRRIAIGKTGETIAAEMPERSGVSAVKILKPEIARDKELAERYLEVVSGLLRLRHNNVATVLEARRLDDERVVVVTEFIEARTLGEVLDDEGPLEPNRVVPIARQICLGLAAAHTSGVLHLDLTVDNVFVVEREGKPDLVKLFDFGTALLRPALEKGQPVPANWSPEQLHGGPMDARTDIFALGVLLYRALSGESPFGEGGGTLLDVAPTRLAPERVPLPKGQPRISESLEQIVLRCLQPEPGKRFRSPEEILHVLHDVRPTGRTQPVAIPTPQTKPRVSRVRVCPECGGEYPPHVDFCGTDGAQLPPVSLPEPDLQTSVVGKTIGAYHVIRMVGEGGMGRVFLAEHVLLGRKVALKMLLPEFALSKVAIRRFFHEARAISQLAHENIIQITDFVEQVGGNNYYVMEYLDGFSVHSLLRDEQALPAERAVRIASQICDALAAVHAVDIIHRDLKPDNVFILDKASRPDFVKLLDFGVAKLVDADGQSLGKTRVGVVLGTPEYMAPEQAAAKPVDHRVDVYAMGVMLYQMMTGRVPYSAHSVGQLLVKQATTEAPTPSELDGLRYPIPPAFDPVILRCLAMEPGDRYKDMSVLKAALERTLQSR